MRWIHHPTFHHKSQTNKEEFSKFIRQFYDRNAQRLFLMQVPLTQRTFMGEGKDQTLRKDWLVRKVTWEKDTNYWALESRIILKITFKLGQKSRLCLETIASSFFSVNQGIRRVRVSEPVSKSWKHFSNSQWLSKRYCIIKWRSFRVNKNF